MRLLVCLILISLTAGASLSHADSPLLPIKTDTPRDTMRTFMEAMNEYRVGKETGDLKKVRKIERAVRLFERPKETVLAPKELGEEAAIYLKEVIDRVIVIDYEKIPDDRNLTSWRLKDTEITIRKMTSGPREGEYLFSADTVERAKEFYALVNDLPYLPESGQGAAYQSPWLEKNVPTWAKSKTLGFYHWQWIGTFVAIFLGLFFKRLAEIIIHFSKRFATKTTGGMDDELISAVEKPIGLVIATAVWFVLLSSLQLDGVVYNILSVTIQAIFSISVIWFFLNITKVLTDHLKEIAKDTDFPLDDQLVPLFQKALRLFIVVFGALISIQNLGVNVMSLMAGLGLGGLAFALAAQDTAANFFGSVMILWDQPFKVGDWIKSKDAEGTVEEIGFRSTRLRSFYNSEVSIPNSQLANANIDNMGRRRFRRIVSNLGVTYDTPPEKMEAFLEGLKNIIKANEYTRKDYYHVVFSGYGPSSLDIMLYFFFECPDWSVELVERQNIYLEILRLAQALKINFAFPTQTVHVESTPTNPAADLHTELNQEKMGSIAKKFGPGGEQSKPTGLGLFTAPFKDA
jgi:MscS family membrane protein